jgi:hypothetical protein
MDTPPAAAPQVLSLERAPAVAKRYWAYVALVVVTCVTDVSGGTLNGLGSQLFELLLMLCLFELAFVSARFAWRRFAGRKVLALAATAFVAGASATWVAFGADAEPWYIFAIGAGLPVFILSFAILIGLAAVINTRRP